MKAVTILVIDDDEAVRQTLLDILELNGYETLSASNGQAGFELAQARKPSLIITDISMPGLGGLELLTRLRTDLELRDIPVIVISAKTDRAATRRGMDLGAADYITKPFTEEEILQSIGTRLANKELLDELDAFAHTVAHDLRNPLCALKGQLYLAATEEGPDAPRLVQEHLSEANQITDTLASILDELLILAGVRRQIVCFEQIDTAGVVAEAISRLETLLKDSHATIRQPETWPVAFGHAPWVVHIWVNYIGNALKYAGPNVDILLGSGPGEDPRRVRFWVQDRGPGLDAAACQRLFVPFTRISTVRVKGHGLGLSIVRRIAEKLGGAVGVESELGKGSRFWFELPAAQPGSDGPHTVF